MKRIFTLLLTLTIFSGIVPLGTNVVAKAETMVELPSLAQVSTTFDAKKYASNNYAALEQLIFNVTTACKTDAVDINSFGYTVAEVEGIVNACTTKYPELYHLDSFSILNTPAFDTNNNGKLDSNEKAGTITFEYFLNEETYNKYNFDAKQAAAEMLADIKVTQGLTTLQKLLLLHDRIAVRCEYDYAGYERYERAHASNEEVQIDEYVEVESFSMYGTLVLGKAVCEGYAKTYQYMLNELGIENYLCASDKMGHVWNIVKLDGKYYHVDITFDDSGISGDGYSNTGADRTGHVRHKNFLRSSEGIYAEGHDKNDYDTAPYDTTYDNYFWQESETAFTLLKGNIYYINNTAKKLMQWQGGNGVGDVELYDVSYVWGTSFGNFSCLSGDTKHLYFNSENTVFEYNIENDIVGAVHELPLEQNIAIYGFKAYNNEFYCDVVSSHYYYAAEKQSGMHIHRYSEDGFDISTSARVACEHLIKDMVYTGNAITFPIDIYAGGKHLVENVDFTVTYENNINVGTARVAIHGIGNYSGWDVEAFSITPVSINGATVSNIVDKSYTGNEITQTPNVSVSGKKLFLDSDYSLSCINNIATGKATVKISGIGNYKGSISKNFYIHPKKVEKINVKKATPTSITIGWEKAPSGTGYAVLCSTSKTGKYKTVGLINKKSTTTFTHKKRSKNKTYYYKVIAYKTVDGVKKTSVASSILTAKTATATPKITYYKNASKNSVKLKWGKVKGASGYQVYMKVGKKYKKVYSGKKLTCTVKKLKKGKTYQFKVRTYKPSHKIMAYSSYSTEKKVKITK